MSCLLSAKIKSYALFALSLAMSVLVQAAPTSAILIDFETYPGGAGATSAFDPINTQFSPWGISYMESRAPSGASASPVIGQWPDYPSPEYPLDPETYHSGISALAPHPGDDDVYGFAQAPIHVSFSSSIDYFSVYAMDVGWNGLTVNAFDVNSSLIDSVTIDGDGREHYGLPDCQDDNSCFDRIEFSIPGIVEISFSQIHDAAWDRERGLGLEGYLLDDMSFNLVPEPSAVVLVALGLMGLSRFGRRRLPRASPPR